MAPVTRHTRTRRGFTLTETMVFVPLGLMVMGMVWGFLMRSTEMTQKTDVKLQGLQANLILAMRLERDLESLYESRQYRMLIGDNGGALRFFRVADESPEAEWGNLPLEEVDYTFDASTGKVTRTVNQGKPDVLPGYFEMVHFRVETPPKEIDPAEDLPPAASVVFTAVAIPEEILALEAGGPRDPRRRTTLVSGIPMRWISSRNTYPFWNPIPYLPPPRETPPDDDDGDDG